MPGIALRRWNLLELFVVPFAASVMRVSWVYPLLKILTDSELTGAKRVQIPFSLLVALAFGGAMTSHLDRSSRAGRTIAVGGGFAACLISLLLVFPGVGLISLVRQLFYWHNTLPAPFVMLVAAALLWWRGMVTEHMNHEALARAFLTGTGMMVALLLLGRVLPSLLTRGQLVSALILFLVSGLMTLALAGASRALRQSSGGISISLQLSRHWLLAVLLVIGSILLLGWITNSLVAPDAFRQVIAWLRPIWNLLGLLLYYILFPFVYILFMLLEPLLRWLSRLYNRPQEPGPQPTPTPEEQLEQIERTARNLPPALDFLLRIALAAALVLLVASLFLLALRRRQPGRYNGVLESRESIWSWDLMRSQLASLLRRRRREVTPPLFLPLLGDPADPRLAIRAAYQSLLALAMEKGYPRSYAQTPYAYQETLRAMCPDQGEALRTITEAYVTARYSAQPPLPAQASAAWQAVERIHAALTSASPDLAASQA